MLTTDPVDLLLNPATGDLVVGSDITLSTGVAAVVQAARIQMAVIRGEWFLDLDFGVPYFERVGVPSATALFAQKFNQGKAVATFRAALGAVPGVTSITRLDIAFNGSTRAMTVVWAAKTTFGDTPADTLVLGQ